MDVPYVATDSLLAGGIVSLYPVERSTKSPLPSLSEVLIRLPHLSSVEGWGTWYLPNFDSICTLLKSLKNLAGLWVQDDLTEVPCLGNVTVGLSSLA